MEVFIWTLLVEKRESTDDHEMGGMTKNELRHYAKDYTYAKFKRAVKELEDACIKMLSLQSCNPEVVNYAKIVNYRNYNRNYIGTSTNKHLVSLLEYID